MVNYKIIMVRNDFAINFKALNEVIGGSLKI